MLISRSDPALFRLLFLANIERSTTNYRLYTVCYLTKNFVRIDLTKKSMKPEIGEEWFLAQPEIGEEWFLALVLKTTPHLVLKTTPHLVVSYKVIFSITWHLT